MSQPPLWRGMRYACRHIEEIIANTALVIMVIASTWAVVSRYIVPTPAVWTIEVITVAFAWAIFVGSAAVYKRRQHVSVDLLIGRLPARFHASADRLIDSAVMVFCLVSAYLGLEQAIASHQVITGVAGIPLSVPYIGFTVGMLLMSWRAAQAALGRRWQEAG